MTLTLRDGVSATPTDEGMVLLDEHGGRYWQLNDTGALVLVALLDGATPGEAARRLLDRHPGLDPDRARDDVSSLLTSLRVARLVSSPSSTKRAEPSRTKPAEPSSTKPATAGSSITKRAAAEPAAAESSVAGRAAVEGARS
ncbi:hypothetical protein Misp01_46680 [Microtetraspora sp. NBRC 13810]|uniref:lasso peptide biosynthesis PqqD family chaperone n=1 Tax=Microtetraspora sp. NBRC 13810 TaxID=3030990 RepID=UPI0024A4E0BC|nr:lasso peptide biosynthesis PqqD family chaperone [Microtetraspora sp. NBRC 13810]GLW09539.1 hypothetical protein Misp01_46680 [Microtetraspora sp. NBRC 13810]